MELLAYKAKLGLVLYTFCTKITSKSCPHFYLSLLKEKYNQYLMGQSLS